MKLFTVEEVNSELPRIRPKLERLRILIERLAKFRDRAHAAAAASTSGGGMLEGTAYVKTLYEAGKITAEISERGAQLKDQNRGLIDFPSLRDDRVVLLCWQLGEDDVVEWWHETEAGFAGRQPL